MQRNAYNYNFYCRTSKVSADGTAPIELSIMINGKRCFINLPMKVSPEDFNRKRQPKFLADYLSGMRVTINQIINDMLAHQEPVTAENLRAYIRTGGFKSYTVGDMFNDFLKIARGRIGIETNRGTYRKYELVRDLVYSYISKDMEATALTADMLVTIYNDLKQRFQPSTSASYMRKIKTIVMYAIDKGKVRVNPFAGLKVRRVKTEIEYLTEEDLEILHNAVLDSTSLQHVLDIFLFICYSGLSFADAAALKPEDLKQLNGMWIIEKPRKKSHIQYTSVILPREVEIFQKYNGNLGLISNQKINLYLKVIQSLIGFEKRLYCHLGRKTYATLLVNHDVPIVSVARCLGHSDVRTTQRYYARLHDSTVVDDVAKAFGKQNK